MYILFDPLGVLSFADARIYIVSEKRKSSRMTYKKC